MAAQLLQIGCSRVEAIHMTARMIPTRTAGDGDAPIHWLEDRRQRVLRGLWLVLLLVLVGYAATTVPGVRDHRGYNPWLDGWLQNGVLAAATLLIVARAVLCRTQRLAWGFIACGVGLYALGNVLYFGWVQYDAALPYPSVADAAWLAMYVSLFAGLMSLARPRLNQPRTLWLDGIVGASGITAVATIWLEFVLARAVGSRAAVLTTMAYPVGDLILLVLVIGTCGLLGWRPGRMWLYLGAGMVVFAAADTTYAIRVATGTFQAGTLLDPTWAAAAVILALAALSRPQPYQAASSHGWSVLAVPAGFVLSALVLLVYGTWQHIPAISVLLATVTILGGLARGALTFRDVRSLAASREQARTDELTGLGNRRHLHEVAQERIAARPEGEQIAILLLDLDRFKEVNDGLGHSIGDLLLVEVGARLAQACRGDDQLVRLGGDEFAVLLSGSSTLHAQTLAERLRTALQAAFVVDGMTVYVDVSIGIAMCPEVASTVEGLLQRADIAMYKAKADRLGVAVYEPGGTEDITARLRRTEELRRAIDEDQLVLHYQPKLDLVTGRIDSVEALVRWDHPTEGLLFPDAFLPEAERYGFMRRLTTCVLGIALDQAQTWRSTDGPTNIAVNVSASNLLDRELPDQIETMLQRCNLPGAALTVEVTEENLMIDPERALDVLRRLRDLGVLISIDDYGTGYSSLARLRDMPVTELKLDRSFVRDIDLDERAAAIVDSTIKLAHSLGLKMVAEGIETEATLQALAALGCDIGQGYHLGRPTSAENLLPLTRRPIGNWC